MRISQHAIQAYEIFYPLESRLSDDEIERRVRDAVSVGSEIEPQLAMSMLGRRASRPETQPSRYVLHAERTGIFVIVKHTVVTFLRFVSLAQHNIAVSACGAGAPITGARIRWASNPGSYQADSASAVLIEDHLSRSSEYPRSIRKVLDGLSCPAGVLWRDLGVFPDLASTKQERWQVRFDLSRVPWSRMEYGWLVVFKGKVFYVFEAKFAGARWGVSGSLPADPLT